MCVRRKSCTVKSFVGGEEWAESLLPDHKIYVTVDVSFSFLTITQEHMSWHLNQVSWPSSFQMLRHLFFFAIFFSSLMQTQNTPAFSAQTETCAIALMISLLELYVPWLRAFQVRASWCGVLLSAWEWSGCHPATVSHQWGRLQKQRNDSHFYLWLLLTYAWWLIAATRLILLFKTTAV